MKEGVSAKVGCAGFNKTLRIKRFGLNLFGQLQLIGLQNLQIDVVIINTCVLL